jgi:hypothetical protein
MIEDPESCVILHFLVVHYGGMGKGMSLRLISIVQLDIYHYKSVLYSWDSIIVRPAGCAILCGRALHARPTYQSIAKAVKPSDRDISHRRSFTL